MVASVGSELGADVLDGDVDVSAVGCELGPDDG